MSGRPAPVAPLDTSALHLEAYGGASASPAGGAHARVPRAADPAPRGARSRSRTSRCSRGAFPGSTSPGLQDKLVRRRRGGYCFEQNTLFRAVLQAVGFDAQPMEARIRSGVPADVVTGAHAPRHARRPRRRRTTWWTSAAAPSRRSPARARQPRRPGRRHRRLPFVDVGDELLLQTLAADGWTDAYQLIPARRTRSTARWATGSSPRTPTVDAGAQPARGRAIEGGRLRLFNRRLSTFRPQTAAPVGASCRRARSSPTCSPTASAWTSRRPISTR